MKIFGKILAVLYSIIFSVVILIISLLIGATSLLNSSFYKELATNIDLKEIKVSSFGISDDPNANLEDVLTDTLTKAGIDNKTAKAIMENPEIKELTGKLIGYFVNYFINNGNVPQINRDDVNTVLNNPEVQKVIGNKYSQKDIDNIVNEINQMLEDICKNGGELNGRN